MRGFALITTLVLAVTTAPVAGTAPAAAPAPAARPRIVCKPIPFPRKRKREMAAYVKPPLRHHGLPASPVRT